MEGTKPSVSDRLPCWGGAGGGWLEGSWGKPSGDAEGGEGGGGPASGSCMPPPSPQREGRWPLGNWAAVGWGQREPKLNTGWALMGKQGATGLQFSGEGDPVGVIQATARRVPVSTDTDRRVVPVPLPGPPARTSLMSLPTAALDGPCPQGAQGRG